MNISFQVETAVSFLLDRSRVACAARPTQDQRPRAYVTRVGVLRRVTLAGLRQPAYAHVYALAPTRRPHLLRFTASHA